MQLKKIIIKKLHLTLEVIVKTTNLYKLTLIMYNVSII